LNYNSAVWLSVVAPNEKKDSVGFAVHKFKNFKIPFDRKDTLETFIDAKTLLTSIYRQLSSG